MRIKYSLHIPGFIEVFDDVGKAMLGRPASDLYTMDQMSPEYDRVFDQALFTFWVVKVRNGERVRFSLLVSCKVCLGRYWLSFRPMQTLEVEVGVSQSCNPSPATRAIATVLKAGETLCQRESHSAGSNSL